MNRINVEKKVFNILCPRCHNVFKVGEGVPWKGLMSPLNHSGVFKSTKGQQTQPFWGTINER